MNRIESLVSAALLCVATSVFALDPSVVNFLGSSTGMFLTNNTTTLFGATNVEFIVGNQGPLEWSFNTNVITPTFVGGSTINGVNYGGTIYYTNAQTALPNGNIATGAWQDLSLWPNANADSNIPVISFWVNANCNDGTTLPTNQITFTLYREYGTNVDTGSGFPNGNTFTAAFSLQGLTNLISSTNLTSIFQNGATGVRVGKIVVANSTTNNFVRINAFGLSGFRP